jgi:hypothetical protein
LVIDLIGMYTASIIMPLLSAIKVLPSLYDLMDELYSTSRQAPTNANTQMMIDEIANEKAINRALPVLKCLRAIVPESVG